MSKSSTDRIEKKIELKAPLAKVWRVLSDHREFGKWFGVKLEGPFAPGKTTRGKITHPGYEHLVMEVKVEKMEPERLLSFRWHPYAVDPKVDYSKEPMTWSSSSCKNRPRARCWSSPSLVFTRFRRRGAMRRTG